MHQAHKEYLHVILNAYWEDLSFELPPLPAGLNWFRIVDTALPSPQDFNRLEEAEKITTTSYQVSAKASVVLMAQPS